jgi:hypothetical protein
MEEEEPFSAGAAIVLSTLTKYAGAMFLPILLVQRRWRTAFYTATLALGWSAIALAIMGAHPFVEFATKITPTLARSNELPDNISLAGALLHALHQVPPLVRVITVPLSILQLLTLAAIFLPMIRLGPLRMREPAAVCAAAMSLLGWLLFFSPIAWSHYLLYLCPLWGWLACPTSRNPRWRTLAWMAMAMIFLSPDQMPPPAMDPWGVHLPASLGLMLGLGISGLYGLISMPAAMPASRVEVKRHGLHGGHGRRTVVFPAGPA